MEEKKNAVLNLNDFSNDLYSVLSVARERGKVILEKDGKQQYALYFLNSERVFDLSDDEKIDVTANRILQRYLPAFEELAK